MQSYDRNRPSLVSTAELNFGRPRWKIGWSSFTTRAAASNLTPTRKLVEHQPYSSTNGAGFSTTALSGGRFKTSEKA